MGIAFQDFRLINNLTVRENVALPLRIFDTKGSIIRRHVPELLEWVGLAHHLDDLPRQFAKTIHVLRQCTYGIHLENLARQLT